MPSLAKVMERYVTQNRREPSESPPALTAQTLCREALVILGAAMGQKKRKAKWPAATEPFKGGIKGLHGVLIYINDHELSGPPGRFLGTRLVPAIEAWAQDFRDTQLGGEYLQLPLGCTDAANERWHGVAMRCVIMQDQPVGARDLPGRHWTKYYDVACDEFKEDYCSTAVSFWVHTPDTAARLLDAA